MQPNSKITELEAKLAELQQELTVLQMQDKQTPIAQDDPYRFLGSDSGTHFWLIEPEKEEGPGVPAGHQLWGLLPE